MRTYKRGEGTLCNGLMPVRLGLAVAIPPPPTVLVVSAISAVFGLLAVASLRWLVVCLVAKGGTTSVAPRSISGDLTDSHSLLSFFLFLSQRRQQSR